MPILGRVSTGRETARKGSATGPQTPYIRDPDADKMRANRDLVGKVITFCFIVGVIRALPLVLDQSSS